MQRTATTVYGFINLLSRKLNSDWSTAFFSQIDQSLLSNKMQWIENTKVLN